MVYVQCFELDLASFVASENKLLKIHSSAEEFDATAEEAHVLFQVTGITLHVLASCLQTCCFELNEEHCKQDCAGPCINTAILPQHCYIYISIATWA